VKDIKPRLHEILKMALCERLDITAIEGAICQDQVHMYLSCTAEALSCVPYEEDDEGKTRGVSA
jgi:hypothetical protein